MQQHQPPSWIALQDITPDIEISSADEAFLDITCCQCLLDSPTQIARLEKQKVFDASGILYSIGVSGDKTTAKFSAKPNKRDSLTVIPPWDATEWLREVLVSGLCGLAKDIGRFLADHGVHTCGEIRKRPISTRIPGRIFQIRSPCYLSKPLQAASKCLHGDVAVNRLAHSLLAAEHDWTTFIQNAGAVDTGADHTLPA